MVIFIDGKKVCLRPVFKEDLQKDYLRWINDRSNDGLTGHALFPHTLADLESFFMSRIKDKRTLWLAIIKKENDRHIGNIELSDIDLINGNAEYKILLDKNEQGKGLGYEASKLILDHGFKKLNLHRIYLGVHQDNKAALGLYKKLGFKVEGTLRQHFHRAGQYKNIIVMGLLSREHQ